MYTNDLDGYIKNMEDILANINGNDGFERNVKFAIESAKAFKRSNKEKPQAEFNTKHEG